MILQQMNLASLEGQTSQSEIRNTINRLFWLWFQVNADRPVRIKKWFVNITVRVSSLEGLFELLFGANPNTKAS